MTSSQEPPLTRREMPAITPARVSARSASANSGVSAALPARVDSELRRYAPSCVTVDADQTRCHDMVP